MDPRSTRLLWDLRAALLKAMAESEETRRVLDRLRENGWSAYLVIDGAEDGEDAADAPATQEPETLALARRPDIRSIARWSGDDLCFLRSLGIDPEPDPEPQGV